MGFKHWSLYELKTYWNEFKELEGFFVRDLLVVDKELLVFELYFQSLVKYLYLDLRANSYFLGIHDKKPTKSKKVNLPIGLFIKAHIINRKISQFVIRSEFGRLMEIHFTEDILLEIRLYPSDLNLGAQVFGKRIFFKKPKDLKPILDNFVPDSTLRPSEKFESWFQFRFPSTNKNVSPGNLEQIREKQIQREESILRKMKDALQVPVEKDWLAIARKIEIEREQFDFPLVFDTNEIQQFGKWSFFVEEAYSRHKKQLAKKSSLENRILIQIEKIDFLKGQDLKSFSAKSLSSSKDLQEVTQAKTRSKNIASDLRLHIGKSAKDNISLLRIARPWHYWFHLKDLPGSHGILECNKNRILSPSELELSAIELVNCSNKLEEGELVEVQYTQCRYVRPIKGDKLGRVSVQTLKVISVRRTKVG